MKKIVAGCLAFVLIFSAFTCAGAEKAKKKQNASEIKKGITYNSSGQNKDYQYMRDDDFSTGLPLKGSTAWLEIHTEKPVFGIYLMLLENNTAPLGYDIQIKNKDGAWENVAKGGEYLVNWHQLDEGVREFRIQSTGKGQFSIAELRLYGKGKKPKDLQEWKTIEKCDMMLITAHCDDEVLWFAGLLPTYAGERGLRVQVAVLAPGESERKLELLHAIWHCGVTAYPEFIGLADKKKWTLEEQYKLWKGETIVQELVTDVIRRHQPEVIVTHGKNGEYGHGAHKVACDVTKKCFKLAAKENKFPESAIKYGTWQAKKLYLHEYTKHVIPCNWNKPLKAFGGKNGYNVAAEAFQYHRSQIIAQWNMNPDGTVFRKGKLQDYDNSLFGLYYTKVGQDSGIGDFMEHIDLQ